MGTSVVTPFKRNKRVKDLRDHLNGPVLLGSLATHLKAIESIEKELEDSIKDIEREILDEKGKVIRTEYYRSTILDKDTIAVFHVRMNARKLQIDTVLKMLNKVMPDLKAIESSNDLKNATDRALEAFAAAAAQE